MALGQTPTSNGATALCNAQLGHLHLPPHLKSSSSRRILDAYSPATSARHRRDCKDALQSARRDAGCSSRNISTRSVINRTASARSCHTSWHLTITSIVCRLPGWKSPVSGVSAIWTLVYWTSAPIQCAPDKRGSHFQYLQSPQRSRPAIISADERGTV